MLSSEGRIPEIADWDAGECGGKNGGKTVGGNGDQHDPAGDSHSTANKDAEVLHDDRGLHEKESGVV